MVAREDFLELAQSSPSVYLKCGQQAVANGKLEFLVSSCWLGCLSFTLARFSAIPTFMRFYVEQTPKFLPVKLKSVTGGKSSARWVGVRTMMAQSWIR